MAIASDVRKIIEEVGPGTAMILGVLSFAALALWLKQPFWPVFGLTCVVIIIAVFRIFSDSRVVATTPTSEPNNTPANAQNNPPSMDNLRYHAEQLFYLAFDFENEHMAFAQELRRKARGVFLLAGETDLAMEVERHIAQVSPELEI